MQDNEYSLRNGVVYWKHTFDEFVIHTADEPIVVAPFWPQGSWRSHTAMVTRSYVREVVDQHMKCVGQLVPCPGFANSEMRVVNYNEVTAGNDTAHQ